MKRFIALAVLITAVAPIQAQEKYPREDALKVAFYLSADLKQLIGTPIPTDPDIKRPVAVRDGEYGGMVLPETKLSAEVFTKAGKDPVPVGQLWLRKLSPLVEGQVVSKSKLRVVRVYAGSEEEEAICCALAVTKGQNGNLELLVYGKDKEPVARTPLKSISSKQEDPVEISAERQSDGAQVTLKFLGKFEGTFMVTDPDRY